MATPDFKISVDQSTGLASSVKLYGEELLDEQCPSNAELFINGLPLKTRLHHKEDGKRAGEGVGEHHVRLKGEKFVDHFSGCGLVINRNMGPRPYMKYNCYGVNYLLRRELADMTDLPCPGPGGPVIEAPLYVDSFGLFNWNWKFWGDDTRMIFPSSHTNGPADEFGHIGYENDTPEVAKNYMQNVWRRIYPGVLVIHGGLFYNAKTEHWIAITCRRAHVGYILNLENGGRGVSYDFTLHAEFEIGDWLRMPEIKIYYGKTREEMMHWMGEYVTFYYEEPPEWVFKTVWGHSVCWNNQPTWTQQADFWEAELDKGEISGIGYCLVTNRAVYSGTSPTGYEPDPNHGTIDDFRKMCRRVTDRGVPLLIWMSHSGIIPGAQDIGDDWFIRGIDGRMCAGWGNVDSGMYHVNPGHPGYIEYTKKWIRFYMNECGCKGIFFDCLGWASPADFTPRDFMRYPGDTNLMAIKFMEEVYACIKECDPEGIMLGEGTSLDAPVNIFSISGNPVRAIDGMGPRDFFLQLNKYSPKQMVVDQGGPMFPASGMVKMATKPGAPQRNKFLVELLKKKGGPGAFMHLIGDLSVIDDLLIVNEGSQHSDLPHPGGAGFVSLPEQFKDVTKLVEKFGGPTMSRGDDGAFREVPSGIYQMVCE